MNILAVDDEYHALKMLESAISEAVSDAVVYLCRSSEAALQTAGAVHVDVAFLDIHMAGMNGIELARELKLINPKINIIFATGFSDYMREGIELRMSGYLFKPVTAEAVKTEMDNLRNPIEWKSGKKLRVVTFGNFEVYVGDTPVKFARKQAKEIFAYIIDKRGTSVTYSELAAVLWEDGDYDRTEQKNLQVYVASLVKSLDEVGAKDVILKSRQGIMVNTSLVDCDYYRFLDGDVTAINSFTGQYMSAYSWAEFTTGYLDNQLNKIKR
ncbi:MAG: response regulator [Ruminococcaceae bacterium]|nr:response regulator [Oscillospiraceae bacterium]